MNYDLGNHAKQFLGFENQSSPAGTGRKAALHGKNDSIGLAELEAQQTPVLLKADARSLPLNDGIVDLIVTSPPYWQKRDYGYPEQIGLEKTPEEFIANLSAAMHEWRRVLKPSGSVFLNIGDTYFKRSLVGIPGMLEVAAAAAGWTLRNRIIWSKESGMPDPSKNRLANRHEYILHWTKSNNYYYDIVGYSERFGNGANPGDVWSIGLRRDTSKHLAPFPDEIVERAIHLACPEEVCPACGHIRSRIYQRTARLDPNRPQARRAMELAEAAKLTPAHIAAIQATGISDAGKALRVQTGTGKNTAEVQRLALEAKQVLGGYFREFTFAQKETLGWTKCNCKKAFSRAIVLDPFAGTGTTLRVAKSLGRIGVGVDLAPEAIFQQNDVLEDRDAREKIRTKSPSRSRPSNAAPKS